jgi:hypothetical protein
MAYSTILALPLVSIERIDNRLTATQGEERLRERRGTVDGYSDCVS